MTQNTSYEQALQAAEKLAQGSTEGLYEQLGLRIQDMQNFGGYVRSQQFDADFQHDADDLLGVEDLKAIGKKWLNKFEAKLMNMICDKGDPSIVQITGGKTIPEVAAGLATSAVVAVLASPPAWVIVGTTILAAMIVETGLESLCEQYSESTEASQ